MAIRIMVLAGVLVLSLTAGLAAQEGWGMVGQAESEGQGAGAPPGGANGHAEARLIRWQIAFVTALAAAVLMGGIAFWLLRATYSQDRHMRAMREMLDAT